MAESLSNRYADETLAYMELTFRKLEACVPPPRWTVLGKVRVARYSERTIQQAIVQKLARAISALNASEVLIRAGLTIDHGAFHRIVDENNEDVAFLSLGIIKKDITALHKRFLDGFYAEDFSDPENVGATTKGRDIVKRRSIFHYVQTAFDTGFNLEVGMDAVDGLHKINSGFVHGASPHCMDLCFGVPPRFHPSGMLGTPLVMTYRQARWNLYFRTLGSVHLAALALQPGELADETYRRTHEFEQATGRKA